jgi:hypothetical protein
MQLTWRLKPENEPRVLTVVWQEQGETVGDKTREERVWDVFDREGRFRTADSRERFNSLVESCVHRLHRFP